MQCYVGLYHTGPAVGSLGLWVWGTGWEEDVKALVVLFGSGMWYVTVFMKCMSNIWKKKKHSGNTNDHLKCNYAAHSATNTNANRSRLWPICNLAICRTCCKNNCKGWIVSSPPNKSKSIASPCQGPQLDQIKPQVWSMWKWISVKLKRFQWERDRDSWIIGSCLLANAVLVCLQF